MMLSKSDILGKLKTYNTLVASANVCGTCDELREIQSLKRDMYSYLLEISNGNDVEWCKSKIVEIKKQLKKLGCFIDVI